MSLPPIPGLIPISRLKNVAKNPLKTVEKEVMGEQRPHLIDNATRRKRKHSNPRVNPIFVWVRQENNIIVDVKCEDYDKRNRIVLTKTPNGWRAIPRTETLAPNLKAAVICCDAQEKPRRKSKKHKTKVKKAEEPDVVVVESKTPLDNLLAVAELEFAQQIKEGVVESKEVDYEEDDAVMNQLLKRLEESLESPAEDLRVKTVVEVKEQLETVVEEEEDEDEQPTDLSMPKRAASPRPVSRSSIVIQSPQPSGVPPSPKPLPLSEESITSSDNKPSKPTNNTTLRAMLSNDQAAMEPSRLLELLITPETDPPLLQLKNLLTSPNVCIPDPLLIPKQRLPAILMRPGVEIPLLLCERPELRLPEALKHADLLKDPDILVLTVHQLRIILTKQAEVVTPPVEKAPPPPPPPPPPQEKPPPALPPHRSNTWLPYLQHLEMAAMYPDFLKMFKFPPMFPLPPPVPHYYPAHNQFEYPIYHQQFAPPKNHCCANEKPRPYFNHAQAQVKSSNVRKPPPKIKVPQQPIDLSRVDNVMLKRSKYNNQNQKVSYGSDAGGRTKVRLDEVPEVGSTTSVDDFAGLSLPEPPKNLWNPLYAGSKPSSNSNSWSWPGPITASSE